MARNDVLQCKKNDNLFGRSVFECCITIHNFSVSLEHELFATELLNKFLLRRLVRSSRQEDMSVVFVTAERTSHQQRYVGKTTLKHAQLSRGIRILRVLLKTIPP